MTGLSTAAYSRKQRLEKIRAALEVQKSANDRNFSETHHIIPPYQRVLAVWLRQATVVVTVSPLMIKTMILWGVEKAYVEKIVAGNPTFLPISFLMFTPVTLLCELAMHAGASSLRPRVFRALSHILPVERISTPLNLFNLLFTNEMPVYLILLSILEYIDMISIEKKFSPGFREGFSGFVPYAPILCAMVSRYLIKMTQRFPSCNQLFYWAERQEQAMANAQNQVAQRARPVLRKKQGQSFMVTWMHSMIYAEIFGMLFLKSATLSPALAAIWSFLIPNFLVAVPPILMFALGLLLTVIIPPVTNVVKRGCSSSITDHASVCFWPAPLNILNVLYTDELPIYVFMIFSVHMAQCYALEKKDAKADEVISAIVPQLELHLIFLARILCAGWRKLCRAEERDTAYEEEMPLLRTGGR